MILILPVNHCSRISDPTALRVRVGGSRALGITLKGTVTKVEFMNPHVWIYMDVKDDNGAVGKWQIEGGAPNGVRRNGWSKDSVKEGELLTVDGTMSKDGLNTVNARSVVVAATGKRLFAGSSEGDAKAK
ncbi:MAG: DUF6152 family protein [Acidobacteriota bacterium]